MRTFARAVSCWRGRNWLCSYERERKEWEWSEELDETWFSRTLTSIERWLRLSEVFSSPIRVSGGNNARRKLSASVTWSRVCEKFKDQKSIYDLGPRSLRTLQMSFRLFLNNKNLLPIYQSRLAKTQNTAALFHFLYLQETLYFNKTENLNWNLYKIDNFMFAPLSNKFQYFHYNFQPSAQLTYKLMITKTMNDKLKNSMKLESKMPPKMRRF